MDNTKNVAKKHASSGHDFLKLIKGNPVLVKLNDGSCYTGTFICMDGNLNVVLENVVLWETSEKMKASMANESEIFSDVFIRGNNVCYIAPQGTLATQEEA